MVELLLVIITYRIKNSIFFAQLFVFHYSRLKLPNECITKVDVLFHCPVQGIEGKCDKSFADLLLLGQESIGRVSECWLSQTPT